MNKSTHFNYKKSHIYCVKSAWIRAFKGIKKSRWRKGFGHKIEKLLMIVKYMKVGKGGWIAYEKMRKSGISSKVKRDYLKEERWY